jgi:CRISPR system Cascade subunit CasC
MSRFVTIHALRPVPSNRGNCDEHGNPKTLDWNGRRFTQSSQALKAGRRSWMEAQGMVVPAIRTRLLGLELAERLVRLGRSDSADATVSEMARQALISIGLGMNDKEPDATKALVYLGRDEIEALVDAIHEGKTWEMLEEVTGLPPGPDDTDEVKSARNSLSALIRKDLLKALSGRTQAAGVALFGRMVAEQNRLRLDGAVQVSPSLSVTLATSDVDYWTAMDNLAPHDGAAMIGERLFGSSVYYEQSTVNMSVLAANLGDLKLAANMLAMYLWSCEHATLTGAQNSMSAHTASALFLVQVGRRQPFNLAPAFEIPVQPWRVAQAGTSITLAAIEKLDEYLDWFRAMKGTDGEMAWVSGHPLNRVGMEPIPMQDLIERVVAASEAA